MTAHGRGLHVYKFGGTSLGDATRIERVAGLVADRRPPPLVVVSAMAGVTDRLAALLEPPTSPGGHDPSIQELGRRHRGVLEALGADGPDRTAVLGALDALVDTLREIVTDLHRVGVGPDRPVEGSRGDRRDGFPGSDGRAEALADGVLATGEDLSARLLAFALRGLGQPAEVVDARHVVRTDARFGRARADDDAIRDLARERLLPLLERGVVPVVQGFVGATADGRTTTLGRGGSDFTAALLGAALGAERVHIWTDVDGMLSGDPRTVDEPRILERVGFEEAVELCYFGAHVLHPGAAKHAVSYGVPLQIRNTFRPDGPGTLILQDRRVGPRVAAVAYKPGVALIKVRSHPAALPYGFLARVFEILARHRLPVDLVATSHSSTAFTIDAGEEIGVVSDELRAFAEVEVTRSLATVTVVGRGLLDEPGMDGLVFREVGTTPIHLISQASDVSLSFLVADDDAPGVVRRLHAVLVQGNGIGSAERPEGGAERPEAETEAGAAGRGGAVGAPRRALP